MSKRTWKGVKDRRHGNACYGYPEQNNEVIWCPRCGAIKVGRGNWRYPGRADQYIKKAKDVVNALTTLKRALDVR